MVIPSMPGYGFSGKPTTTGWDPARIARAWTVLMKRLGYTKFVAQGGDWGAIIVDMMGVQAPPELLGIHTNMAGVIPADIDKAAFSGAPAPAGLSADEKRAYERLKLRLCEGHRLRAIRWGCVRRRCTGLRIHPSAWQPISSTTTRAATSSSHASLTDSPKASRETTSSTTSRSTWLTNTAISAARLYWENNRGSVLRRQGRRHPGCRERLPRRALSSSAELGGAGVSQTHPLQQARQRRALCGLGTAEALCRRGSRGF